MRGPGSKSTSLPEPTGPNDDSQSYSLTPEGKAALAAYGNAAERHARRQAAKRSARENGRRCGTVSSRWRESEQVPLVRLSGAWLRAAGFDLGQCFEVGVEEGALMIRAV
jgi:hypothetical protein